MELTLTKGYVAIVDDADSLRVASFKWAAARAYDAMATTLFGEFARTNVYEATGWAWLDSAGDR